MDGKWFNVGKIVNTHGIHGEVRVISTTDFREKRYKTGNRLYIFLSDKTASPIEVVVKSHRIHKNFDLLSFEGYDSINAVEKLKGSMIKIPESQLGDLNEGEFYFHEIIGCAVYTEDGEKIGEIKEILTPGANDVWVVKRKGKKDVLLPYIEEVVKKVDVKEKRVVIFPMEGLLDL